MAWAFEDEKTTETEKLLLLTERETVVVPALWMLEVSNAMVQAVKRKRLTEPDVRKFLASMKRLDKEIDAAFVFDAFVTVFDLALKHRLTAYDSAYLELAHRRKLPLACATAATSLGIPVMGK